MESRRGRCGPGEVGRQGISGRGPRNCGGEARKSRTVIAKGVAFLGAFRGGRKGDEGGRWPGQTLVVCLSIMVAPWGDKGSAG